VSQVTNYTVDNAAGNVVRADINSILDAVKTNNSGGSDPGNPVKFMFYGKSSDDKLKIYDGSNFREIGDVGQDNLGLLPKAGGTLTGALFIDDSSNASAPALAFDGDADTGLFRKAANTLGFSTAGAERAIFDSNGLTVQSHGELRLADSDSSNWVALQAAHSIGSNLTFTLPSADGSNGQMLQTNGSGVLSFTSVQGVPSGAVFCLAVATVPSGYLECNGASVSRTTYAALFAVIGTAYGTASGSTFNVPDLRGEFIRGFDNGKGTDSGRSIATAQSDQNKQHNHTATSTSTVTDPGHIHQVAYSNNDSGDGVIEESGVGLSGYEPTESATTGVTVATATTVANDGGSENRPRNIAMMYVIKT